MRRGSATARIERLAKRLDAWGCTPEEIDAIRRDQGVELPASYEAFLRFLGRDGGGLMGGTDVCYGETFGIRHAAITLLDGEREERIEQGESNPEVFRLPDDAVVISMHQGYAFEFVRASLGDDPPVEWWAEGSGSVAHSTVGATSIADWLESNANETSPYLSPERLRQHRLSSQAMRRRAYRPELCPSCGGPLHWSGQLKFKAGDPDSGRDRSLAYCAAEGVTMWRWADEPGTPLRPELPPT